MSANSQSPTRNEPLFAYDLVPLRSAANSLRLIVLLPPEPSGPPNFSPFEAPLKCRIYAAYLESPPSFQAVSYTWGENIRTSVLGIQANSSSAHGCLPFSQLRITSSLNQALRHLRQPSEAVTLWIDQICIDQSNNEEKKDQVAAMGDIYGRASQVLIWLGPGTDDSNIFIGKMETVGRLARQEGIERLFDRSKRSSDDFWRFMDNVTSHDKSNEVPDSSLDRFLGRASEALFGSREDKWTVAEQLEAWFGRPWFSRVWVLQEYVLATEATFVCGHMRIETDLFVLANTVLNLLGTGRRGVNVQPGGEMAQRAFQNATRSDPLPVLLKLRKSYKNAQIGKDVGHSLYRLVRDVYGTHRSQLFSTDQRDRIYALLNLSNDAKGLGISPDYSESLTTDLLYTQVSRAILKSNGGDLSLLELVQFPKKVLNDNDMAKRLPSWVPDFLHPQESISLPSKEVDGRCLYAPTGVARKAQILHTTDEGIFGLKGIIVDEVDLTGKLWQGGYTVPENDPDACPSHDFVRCLDYLNEVETLCSRSLEKASHRQGIYENYRPSPLRIMIGDITYASNAKHRRATATDLVVLERLLEVGKIFQAMGSAAADHGDENQQAGRTGPPSQRKSDFDIQALKQRLKNLISPEFGVVVTRLEEMCNKVPFLTQDMGYVGMGPRPTQSGDVVVLFFGARTPYVLRPRQRGSQRLYELLGEAYCDGVMDGELSNRTVEDFYLV